MKIATDVILSTFRQARIMTVAAPFWGMAFAAFLMRLLILPPIGALLALMVGIIWCWGNMPLIQNFLKKIRKNYTVWRRGYEQKSLWFDNVGRKQIVALIDRLSANEISYCDLVAEIKMPHASHWYAISCELNKLGILTQISYNAFYIAWKLPAAEDNSENELTTL